MIRTGAIAALILLRCQELGEAATVDLISPPLAGCLCENIQMPAVACDVAGGGERPRADKGAFELLPAAEENSSGPEVQAPTGAYLHARELPLPEPAPKADAEGVPHPHFSLSVRTAGEIAEPLAITVGLAGLAMGTGRKKSRATPGRRHAA
jgi:hypothetical protein